MAYSFAAGSRTEPLLTYVRDQLGSRLPERVRSRLAAQRRAGEAHDGTAPPLASCGTGKTWTPSPVSARQALADNGLPQFEGSNAWAVAGIRTKSGKPLLAGDPHIRFSAPSVWYEAQLSSPGFELYGHYQALMPVRLAGHEP